MKLGRLLWRIPILALSVVAWSAPVSAETLTAEGATDFYFTVTEPVNFSVRTFAWDDHRIDSMLWLYGPDENLVAQNDDFYGLDSHISVQIVGNGTYRLRAGVCCGDPNRWYGTSYTLDANLAPTPPPTTTTLPEVTTTWEPSTTSTLPPTTSTTTAPTTTVPVTDPVTTTTSAPTTTSEPPVVTVEPSTEPPTTAAPSVAPSIPTQTAPSVAPSVAPSGTTTSSSTPTTRPPATSATPNSTTVPPPTSSAPVSSSLPESTSTTPTTDLPTSTTLSSDTSPDTVIPPPANDAPEEAKAQFEEQVNVFGDPAYDDYVPAGSVVTVAQRRAIIAATTATAFALPSPTNRRRHK